MKNGKAPRPDDIPAEVWKVLGHHGITILTTLFNCIITENKVPAAWSTSITIAIWKSKGDMADCSNYSPIRFLCHTMKIFERIMDSQLHNIATITPNQCSVDKGSETRDTIHAARLLMEKLWEKKLTLRLTFLDLEKAFDRVPHDLI